jgi:hypothetical protein
MVIKPTVGRVVWFRPNGAVMGFNVFDDAQPCAATVAYVLGDRLVNLSVVDHSGVQVQVTGVPLRQPKDDVQPEGQFYCEWMPYQVGQVVGPATAEKGEG